MNAKNVVCAMMILPLVAACGAAGRLSEVGRAPRFTPQEELQTTVVERSLARPDVIDHIDTRSSGSSSVAPAPTASLFRSGAAGLFRDQRASTVGDIVTIRINVQDRASVGNTTARSRTSSENAGLGSLFGLENPLSGFLPGNPDTGSLVDLGSSSQSAGSGTTERSETINMTTVSYTHLTLPTIYSV